MPLHRDIFRYIYSASTLRCWVPEGERQIVLSDDIWQIIIKLNTDIYFEAISTVRNALLLVHIEAHKQEFNPLSELQVIETSLEHLETEFLSFKHLLPKLDPGELYLT
jgi:hypothetical protein